MFSQLHPAAPKRQAASLSISLAIHLLFLGWLLHSPAPIFVAPLSVAKGESGIWIGRGRDRRRCYRRNHDRRSGRYCAEDRASKPWSCRRPEGARGASELAVHSRVQERRADSIQAGRLLSFPALTGRTFNF